MNPIEIIVDIAKDVRLSGFLDIAFVTVFIYTILVLFKQSKARLIITGIFILSVIYLIARQLNLALTTSLLQAFFAVILLAVIIIFQEEIRRFFEHIALWSFKPKLRTNKNINPNEKEAEILVDTLGDLAQHKIGALVVIKGKMDLSAYLEGGETLDGKISEPLLKSIFDPNSTGHDGAVVIDRGKITLFGSHLPLSNNFSQLKNRGTRHAAALGMSEVTDALCLVVSEERGTISIARKGELKQIGMEQFKLTLETFYNEIYPPARKLPRFSLFSNYKEKVIALLAAIVLWFVFVHESRTVYRSFDIPIEHATLPDGFKVEEIDPDKVSITFIGPRREFYFFNENQVRLLLKIPNAKDGLKRVSISESNLKFPEDLSLEDIEPSTVTVRIEKIETSNKKGDNSKNQNLR